jgi:hypothetical protein
MRLLVNARLFACGLLVSLLALTGGAAQAQEWGTIKGQVVFGGDKIPERLALKVDKDQADCTPDGKKLYTEDWVIDPKTKGCKWCFVYLVPDSRNKDDLTKLIPTHPDYKKRKLADVIVDQPCCMFDPYCIGLEDGQFLIMKNSMKISHNSKIDGDESVKNPQENPLIPAKGEYKFGPFHPQWSEIPISCNIHGWMSGHIRVFPHPYWAVTKEDGKFEFKNAPAGKYRLVIWHPGAYFLLGDKEPDKFGKQIEIKAGKPEQPADLGQFKVPPPK